MRDWQPEWLRPGDRVRRGHRLFEVHKVWLSDGVRVECRRVDDAGGLGPSEALSFAFGEVVRALLGDGWPPAVRAGAEPASLALPGPGGAVPRQLALVA